VGVAGAGSDIADEVAELVRLGPRRRGGDGPAGTHNGDVGSDEEEEEEEEEEGEDELFGRAAFKAQGLTPRGLDSARKGEGDGAVVVLDVVTPRDNRVERDAVERVSAGGDVRGLLEAAERGDVGAVRRLVECGVAVNGTLADEDEDEGEDGDGTTAAMVAASEGHVGVLYELAAGGADLGMRLTGGYDEGKTALMLALERGQSQCSLWLVSRMRMGDLGAVDAQGSTALLMAAARGDADVCAALLARGVDSRCVDGEGRTVLRVALEAGEGGDGPVVGALLEGGCYAADAVMMAVDEVDVDLLRVLLGRRGREQIRNAWVAAERRELDRWRERVKRPGESAAASLAGGADLDGEDLPYGGNTPLTLAALKGDLAMMKVLLDPGMGGARVDAPRADGKTALLVACEAGDTDVIRLCLSSGADIGAVDRRGRSAFHLCAVDAHEDALRAVLDASSSAGEGHAARVDARNADGLSAMEIAVTHQHEGVACMLVESGADLAQVFPDGVRQGEEDGGGDGGMLSWFSGLFGGSPARVQPVEPHEDGAASEVASRLSRWSTSSGGTLSTRLTAMTEGALAERLERAAQQRARKQARDERRAEAKRADAERELASRLEHEKLQKVLRARSAAVQGMDSDEVLLSGRKSAQLASYNAERIRKEAELAEKVRARKMERAREKLRSTKIADYIMREIEVAKEERRAKEEAKGVGVEKGGGCLACCTVM